MDYTKNKMDIIISNTTPIITLLAIDKLEILKEIYGKIYVPKGVYEEIENGLEKEESVPICVPAKITATGTSRSKPAARKIGINSG